MTGAPALVKQHYGRKECSMEENLKWLWYAFSVAWGIVVVYLISLARREQRLRSELESLRVMVEKK
jgi:bacteriorhodopsin